MLLAPIALLAALGCGGSKGAAPDGGVPSDAGAPLDGGALTACAASYAGCSQSAFDASDFTAPGADRTVSFTCCEYTPNCLKIKVGQSVTFSGAFSSHPLAQGCGPAALITNGAGPFTFNTPGDYGFYCTAHGTRSGGGMAGAIQVVP
jgi:plastocyanin